MICSQSAVAARAGLVVVDEIAKATARTVMTLQGRGETALDPRSDNAVSLRCSIKEPALGTWRRIAYPRRSGFKPGGDQSQWAILK